MGEGGVGEERGRTESLLVKREWVGKKGVRWGRSLG